MRATAIFCCAATLSLGGCGGLYTESSGSSGKTLLYVGGGSGKLGVHAIDASTGALGTVTILSPDSMVNQLDAIALTGTPFLALLDGGARSLATYRITDTAGTLGPKLSSMTTALSPDLPTYDARNHHLYVPINSAAEIEGYSVDPASGALTGISNMPATNTGGGLAQLVAVTPDSKFLYCTDKTGANCDGTGGSSCVYGYSISASGELTSVGVGALTTGTVPFGIAAHPTANLLFATDYASADVVSFVYNTSTGALGRIDKKGPLGSPTYLAVDPGGLFVYVSDSTGTNVHVFAINRQSGFLSEISGSPFDIATTPTFLSFNPSDGTTLYVLGTGNLLYALKIDPVSGAITGAASGSPYATVTSPGKFTFFTPSN